MDESVMLLDREEAALVFGEEMANRSEVDEKKGAMTSTTEIIALRLLKEAGTKEFRRLSKFLK